MCSTALYRRPLAHQLRHRVCLRRSAVEQGYLDDEFIKLFVPRGKRRSPLINRGYFSRVAAVEEVMSKFMELAPGLCAPGVRPQIVSLGAGLDTSFFKLRVSARHGMHCMQRAVVCEVIARRTQSRTPTAPLLYVEVDLPRISKRKVVTISKSARLKGLIAPPDSGIDVRVRLEPGSCCPLLTQRRQLPLILR